MLESRKLEDLIPCVSSKAIYFIARAEVELEIKIIVTCTRRDGEKQHALYQVGRRGIPGERIVTNADSGESFHEFGVAFDIFPIRYGKPVLFESDGDQVSDPIWQNLGRIAAECGLEWAGNWKHFPEGPHFQYTGGLTLAQLKFGHVPS